MSDFAAPLPELIASDPRVALETAGREGYGSATYEPPGGEPIPFVLDTTRLAGGQEVDRKSYPFGGGWSNTAINEAPQELRIEGTVFGTDPLRRRRALLEALRVRTADDRPGYIALPLWGRFPVVVTSWEASDNTAKTGRTDVKITCNRVGIAEVARRRSPAAPNLDAVAQTLATAAQAAYVAELPAAALSVTTLRAAAGQVVSALQRVVGRAQAAVRILNDVSNAVTSITNLVAQGVNQPRELAAASFAAFATIVAAVTGVQHAGSRLASDLAALAADRLETAGESVTESAYRVALELMGAATVTFDDVSVATVQDLRTHTATVNLYRLGAFYTTSRLLSVITTRTAADMRGLLSLFAALERSLDLHDPSVYRAVVATRSAAIGRLQARPFAREKRLSIRGPLPALPLAYRLGVPHGVFERLNQAVADQFMVSGKVRYV